MAIQQSRGASAFEQLRDHFESTRLRCPECGHVDAEGSWRVTTTGSRVRYQHVCPSCGAADTRELRLG